MLKQAVGAVRERLGGVEPRVAIVLGSGLGALADGVDTPSRIPYGDISGFPLPSVHGHAGEFVIGSLEGVPVILQSGRFHLYEGHAIDTVVMPVRMFAELGIDTLIVTNAAGGLRATFRPPLLMLIADHLNLMWRSPLMGPVVDGEERFPDMSEPYDRGLRGTARAVANQRGIALEEGVYAGLLGPSYETPAEIRMLQRIGADAVGMSTVPEVVAARARALRVMGVSSITNWGAGLSNATLSHQEVLDAGRALAGDLESLVRGVVTQIGGTS